MSIQSRILAKRKAEDSLFRAGLWGAGFPIIEPIEDCLLDDLRMRAFGEKMLPTMISYHRVLGLPETAVDGELIALFRYCHQVRLKSLEILIKLFDKHGISVQLLKGLDFYFNANPRGIFRHSGDSDFLVRKDDIDHVNHLLTGIGFIPGFSVSGELRILPNSLEVWKSLGRFIDPVYGPSGFLNFVKTSPWAGVEGITVDDRYLRGLNFTSSPHQLAWRDGYSFSLSEGIKIPESAMWANPRILELPSGNSILTPSITHLLFYQCLELTGDSLRSSGVKMRLFFDVLNLIKNKYSEIDWDELLYLSEHEEITSAIYYTLTHIRELVPNVPDRIIGICQRQLRSSRFPPNGGFMPALLKRSVMSPEQI